MSGTASSTEREGSLKRDTLLKRTSLGILAGILLVTLLTVLKVPLSGYAVACAIYAGTVFALES